MTPLLFVIAATLGVPETIVHDASFVAGDPAIDSLRDEVEEVAAKIEAALEAETDLAKRRALTIERELAGLVLGRTSPMTAGAWAYLLDVADEREPLESFFLLRQCALAARVQMMHYVLCMEDAKRFMPGGVITALGLRADIDPILKYAAAKVLPKFLNAVRDRFRAAEETIDKDPHLSALRDVAATAPVRWKEIYDEQRSALETAGEAEASFLLGAEPEAYAGCDVPRLDLLLAERLSSVVRTSRMEAGKDFATAALLRARGLCARKASDRATTMAIDYQLGTEEVIRGPRTLARALAVAADHTAGRRAMEGLGDSGATLSTAVVRQGDDDALVHTLRGRVASLTVRGHETRVKLASEKVPDVRYQCDGSGRITGLYRIGDGFGVSRDMSCGFVKVGTIKVPGGQVALPTSQLRGVKAGHYVVILVNEVEARRDATPYLPPRLVWAAKDASENGLIALLGFPTTAFGAN